MQRRVPAFDDTDAFLIFHNNYINLKIYVNILLNFCHFIVMFRDVLCILTVIAYERRAVFGIIG